MAFKKHDPTALAAFDEGQRQLIVLRRIEVGQRVAALAVLKPFVAMMSSFDEKFVTDLCERSTRYDSFGLQGGELGHLSTAQVDQLERITMLYTNQTLAEYGREPVESDEAQAAPSA